MVLVTEVRFREGSTARKSESSAIKQHVQVANVFPAQIANRELEFLSKQLQLAIVEGRLVPLVPFERHPEETLRPR